MTENFQMAALTLPAMAAMVKSTAHLAAQNKTHERGTLLRCVHFAVKGSALRLFASDGFTASWVSHPVEAGDCDSFGVDGAELETAIAALKKLGSKRAVFLSRVNGALEIEADGAPTQRVEIVFDKNNYETILAAKPWAASARIDVKEAVKTLSALGRDKDTIAIHFQRADSAAAAWMDVKVKTVITDVSFKSHDVWNPVFTLTGAEPGPALCADCTAFRLHVQTKFFVNALKHSGKNATVRLNVTHPTGHGGIVVEGDNGCTHLICPLNPKNI